MVVFYRRMPEFDYVRPRSLDEALDLVGDAEAGRYRLFAGGTDILEQLKTRKVEAPEAVVDLKNIPALGGIEREENGTLRIGATATVAEVAASPLVAGGGTALVQGAREIASIQIQNRATIAGNICNAVSSADSAPPLLALDARIVCTGTDGERSIDIADFFEGPGRSTLRPGEIVKDIRIPAHAGNWQSVYLKTAPRGKMDLAWVGVAVAAAIDNGVIEDIRIALGAVAPTPIRARRAEETLRGQAAVPDLVNSAAETAAGEANPRADSFRASEDYRREVVGVLVRRAINQLAA